jgi:hypothetical protein
VSATPHKGSAAALGAKSREHRSRTSPPTRTVRDQQESAFANILAGLVRRLAGARGAVLVDQEGETVDYAGHLPPFELRLAAAYWRLTLDQVAAQPALRCVRWLSIRGGRASYLVHALPDTYALVVVLAPAAAFVGWRRAVTSCAIALCDEAGWIWADTPTTWRPVDVLTDGRDRPTAVELLGGPRPTEVLGMVADGLARGERGYRVRLDSGLEVTLIREPGGVWYADERLDEPHGQGPARSKRADPKENEVPRARHREGKGDCDSDSRGRAPIQGARPADATRRGSRTLEESGPKRERGPVRQND